ncbi:hypothetical protein HDV05_002007 [Chytridiales sp. JEL 0842]|nr:hypothetical protein HDV05_002007 [Chytridiales sp. JEL 0842]
MPNSTAINSLHSLCLVMDWMPGCTVMNLCGLGPQQTTSMEKGLRGNVLDEEFCDPFRVLADICQSDMPRMKGCAKYRELCPTGTAVEQCTSPPPTLPYLPTTKFASELVTSICTEMEMHGCQECMATKQLLNGGVEILKKPCKWFETYASLCLMMPEMEQCATFQNLCSATPHFPLCPTSPPNPSNPHSPQKPPTMKMYFHTGIHEYILLSSWVPQTSWQFAWAWIFIFASAVGYEWILRVHKVLERQWRDEAYERVLKNPEEQRPLLNSDANGAVGRGVLPEIRIQRPTANSSAESSTDHLESYSDPPTPNLPSTNNHQQRPLRALFFRTLTSPPPTSSPSVFWSPSRIRLARTFFRFTAVTISYILMLLIMSYNLFLCLAVVLGLSLGHYLFVLETPVVLPKGVEEEEEEDGDGGDCCG